jgi:Domain of unknown function (DUF1942)
MRDMRRWFSILLAAVSAVVLSATAVAMSPAAVAADIPIGKLGDTLRVQKGNLIADVTVVNVQPSEVPPGFGYPPRPPRHEVWKAQAVVQAVRVPTAYEMAATFVFNGVTPTGDAYKPRNTDAPDALQYSLQDAPQGSTAAGFVFWDCYRDLVSNVVLTDRKSGVRLAQWNL